MPPHAAAGAQSVCLGVHHYVSTKGPQSNTKLEVSDISDYPLCDLLTLPGFLLYQHTTFPNNFKIRCTLKFMSLTT